MSVSKDDIIDAIKNRKVVYIYYDGTDESNYGEGTITKGYRTIEPYVIGMSTANNVVVRAWQQNGASDSFKKLLRREYRDDHDRLGGWRLFYLDGIKSLLLTGKKYSTAKGKIRPHYNPDDKQMTDIYQAVDPDDVNVINSKGLDSISDDDGLEVKGSTFKDAYNDVHKLKKSVFDFYEMITKHRKKSPREYFLVRNDGGGLIAVRETSLKNFDDKMVVGNLKELFMKYSGNQKPTKTFFNNQRELFLKNIE